MSYKQMADVAVVIPTVRIELDSFYDFWQYIYHAVQEDNKFFLVKNRQCFLLITQKKINSLCTFCFEK